MKKILYMAVAAIAALSSCSSNDDILDDGGQQSAGVTEFTASIEGDGTHTSYNASDKKVEWLTTDQINVGGAVYTAKTAGATTTFSGEGAVKTGDVYKAYYPATMYNGGTITLPASYEYDVNFNMPMYAESSTTDLSFKNLCGVLAITVKSDQMTSVSSIVVSADQQMNGECTINYQSDVPTLSFSSATLSDAEKKVSLTFTEAKGITDSETFYLPVPAMSSATLTITVSNGTDTKTMSTSDVVSVERNKMYPITFKAAQMINGHKYVVLAGYKWATENVTASGSIKAVAHDATYGDYFTQDTSGGSTAKEAAESWGSTWTLPTSTQWQALINNCTWAWQDNYSYNGSTVSGYLVTGKDSEAGNSIFLPAAGLFYDGNIYDQGNYGFYLSSVESSFLFFYDDGQDLDIADPTMGMAVRPVSE